MEDADNVEIAIKGVPATQSSAFRSLVSERYPTYVLTALNSTDYSMKLKPTDLQELKVDTVKRAIDTIGNRIDQLGLAEKSVQQYGEAGKKYEVLVQLPGVDDPARAKELIGTAAVLEIVDVKEGPFPSKEGALAQKGGILPLGTKLALQAARDPGRRTVVSGRQDRGDQRTRNAQCAPRAGRIPQVGNQLHPVAGWRQALRPVHGSQHRQPAGGGPGQPDRQRGHDSIQDRGFGPHHRTGERGGVGRSLALPAFGFAAGGSAVSGRTVDRALPGRRFHSPGPHGRYRGPAGGGRRDAGLLQAQRA